MTLQRSLRVTLTAVPLAGAMALGLGLPAGAEPPGIPDPAQAETMLGELQVAEDGSMDGYDRDKFPTWASQGDNCNTREAVLKRDGEGVEVGDDCYPTSGTWDSPYDGGSWDKASDVDIDHVVPLAAAWRTGAADWSQEDREAFANDLEAPQLIAVTDEVNQEKSDDTPAEWMPPEEGYHCTYASMWIASKHKWELTINEGEKAALTDALGTC